jgi:AhpD family alkylhydroperoxidase
MTRYEQFHAYRAAMNARILGDGPYATAGAPAAVPGHAPGTPHSGHMPRPSASIVTKRFFRLDAQAYEPGALDVKTKELLGLVASMVLRCDDCVAYHIDTCVKQGCTDQELWEAFDIALIVGGSIVIPHLRRAVEFLDQCRDAHTGPR